MRRIHNRGSNLLMLPVGLAVLSTMFVLVPLAHMFAYVDPDSISNILCQSLVRDAIWNSIRASSLTTVISLVLAYLLAWCMERTSMTGKNIFRLLVVLPMLIPSVSIGMGAVLLFGNSGIVTTLLQFPGSIYGLQGIVWGSVMYSLPVAFLMIDNILKYEDSLPYEAATVLGIPKWRQFTAITLPYLRKPMIVTAFSVFTLSFTDYGVPLMVGGKYKTLPVLMYQEVVGQLDFGKGCVYGSVLLIPAIIAFLLDFSSQNSANHTYTTKPFELRKSRGRDIVAMIYSAALSIISMLPMVAFLFLAFVKKYPTNLSFTLENVIKTFQRGGGRYLYNSVLIAVCVSILGVTLAILAAYFTARTHSPVNRYLHLISMSMAAIPGVVLGLAYVLMFKGSVFYGTIVILILVNVIHFFASPYLMAYTSFSKVNENLEAVASTLGIGEMHLLIDVLIPKCRETIREMFSYFFVNCMMTISAVSFLATTWTKPIALMINQFEAQAQMERAAVVSLAILVINLVVKITLEFKTEK